MSNRIISEQMVEIQLVLTGLNAFISDAIKFAGDEMLAPFEFLLIKERLAGVVATLNEIEHDIVRIDGSITLNNNPITIVSGKILEESNGN